MEKPFQGIATFLKSPLNDFSRQIGIMGIPYDGSASYRPGARFAPNAIRQASMMLTDGAHPEFETFPADHVTDLGDIAVSNTDVDKSLKQIERAIRNHPFYEQDEKLMFFMGGDHTVTLGILRAMAGLDEAKDLCVLHIDAHCDTWDDHFGDPWGHGTWVRDVVEENIIRPENIIQVGIRSPVDPATKRWLPDLGGHVYSAREAMDISGTMFAERIDDIVDGRPLYISFDIDALDPAFAPGTGTPEFGGLTPVWVLDFLEGINSPISGMDVVEVNPSYDPAGITSLAGATLLWTMISRVCP